MLEIMNSSSYVPAHEVTVALKTDISLFTLAGVGVCTFDKFFAYKYLNKNKMSTNATVIKYLSQLCSILKVPAGKISLNKDLVS